MIWFESSGRLRPFHSLRLRPTQMNTIPCIASALSIAFAFPATPAIAAKSEPGADSRSGNPPNVLFIAIDDLNDWIGPLGGNPQAITPNLDRLAQSGVFFTNAQCTQAVCTASRNSLLSGLRPSTTGWYDNMQPMQNTHRQVMKNRPWLPEHFKRNGYVTMTAGKIFHAGATDYPEKIDDFWDDVHAGVSVDEGEARRHVYYGPAPKGGSQLRNRWGAALKRGADLCGGPLDPEDIPGGRMADEIVADYAIAKLGEFHDRPFFLAVGFVRPHTPYTAPRKYFDLYDARSIQVPSVPADEFADIPVIGKAIALGYANIGDHEAVSGMTSDYPRLLVHAYLACISFVDAQIGRVIAALESSRHASNTIVVLWSDHGQHLGEKRNWRKQTLWEEATRSVLYFRIPGSPAVGRNRSPVSLLDIYPTLVEACGLPAAAHLEGTSLLPLIRDVNAHSGRFVLSTWRYGNHAVRSDDWRYIRYRDGTEELYDHRTDPQEHVNLAPDARFAEIVEEHRKWLPNTDVPPAGERFWEGDELSARLERFITTGVPAWLK